ncbi:hypothetical protein SteCoe_5816 [Stentor coeruleus]|uniref:Uncharacterized protein n=1 Tax=Stentor coeruleus TaxID=5963 RepID=A0A1R2CRE9_9CILI|nr:hypothetical protein SteCoe_5816 [Stentor coeruleus]
MHLVRMHSKSSLGFSNGSQTSRVKHSQKPTHSTFSNPFLKSTISLDSIPPRFLSPVNKVKHEISESIKELQSSGSYLVKAKNACKALEVCASEKGTYQKEMKLIVDAAKEAIFQKKEQVDENILSRIYENHTEVILDNTHIPYIYIAESALICYQDLNQEFISYKDHSAYLHKELSIQNSNLESEISYLKKYINENISEPLRLKDHAIKICEEKLTSSGKMITKLNETNIENDELIKNLKSQISVYKRKVLEMQNIDEEKELKIGQLNKIIDETKAELKSIQEENNKMKYYLGTSLVKLKKANIREKSLEMRNNDVELENIRLGVRAAGRFEDLTPRPSFTGIENLLPDAPDSTKDRVKKIISLALIKQHSEKSVNNKRGSFLITTKRISKSKQKMSPVLSPSIAEGEVTYT